MKINELIKGTVALLTLFVLISGFQINEQSEIVEAKPLDNKVVFAGACNDNGCIGGDDKCMVVSILWGAFQRTCYTTVKEAPKELATM